MADGHSQSHTHSSTFSPLNHKHIDIPTDAAPARLAVHLYLLRRQIAICYGDYQL